MTTPGRLFLIGHPVAHSLSPLMQNAAIEAAGLEATYEAIDVSPDALATKLDDMRAMRAAGNFTVPHKRPAMRHMQKCTSVAMRAGAVNTFWVDENSELAGDNTDVTGFAGMVNAVLSDIPAQARVAIIGAGGAAAAVVTAVEAWPSATVTVHARDLSRAVAIRMRHSVVVRACSMRDPCLGDADIVVNATSLGLAAADSLPVELDRLAPGAVVLDLVYGRDETKFVRAARERGHVAADGLLMLLHQGAAAFERWFGTPPNKEVMWAALAGATGRD